VKFLFELLDASAAALYQNAKHDNKEHASNYANQNCAIHVISPFLRNLRNVFHSLSLT
jgi:hypothetical protein